MSLSYSSLATYRRCPRQYEFACVKKLPQPRTPENSFGVSMHSCLARFGKMEMEQRNANRLRQGYVGQEILKSENAKMQTTFFEEEGLPKTYNLTPKALFNLWRDSFIIDGYATKAAADFDRARGERLLNKFFAWWSQDQRRVVAVEKGWKVSRLGSTFLEQANPGALRRDERVERQCCLAREELASFVITGRFDRIEELPDGTLRIIDWKTGGLRSQAEADQDLQLSLYALAAKEMFKREVSELVLLFLVDEDVSAIVTQRSPGELETAATTIRLLAERIASGDYIPAPSREKCGKCPYRRVCDAAASF